LSRASVCNIGTTSLSQTASKGSGRVRQFRPWRCEGIWLASSMRRAERSLMPALAADSTWLSWLRCCLYLCTWWSVILFAGHAVYLRFMFEGSTVAPPPGPARCRSLTGQGNWRQPPKGSSRMVAMLKASRVLWQKLLACEVSRNFGTPELRQGQACRVGGGGGCLLGQTRSEYLLGISLKWATPKLPVGSTAICLPEPAAGILANPEPISMQPERAVSRHGRPIDSRVPIAVIGGRVERTYQGMC